MHTFKKFHADLSLFHRHWYVFMLNDSYNTFSCFCGGSQRFSNQELIWSNLAHAPVIQQVKYCWWWLLVNTEITCVHYWNCNFFGKQKSMMKSQVCSDPVYCQSLPWSDSCCAHSLVPAGQSRHPGQVKSCGWSLLKLNSAKCGDRRHFFLVLTDFHAKLGTTGIAGTSKALTTDHTYFCFLLALTVAVWFGKEKEMFIHPVWNGCLGLWKLLGPPRRRVL